MSSRFSAMRYFYHSLERGASARARLRYDSADETRSSSRSCWSPPSRCSPGPCAASRGCSSPRAPRTGPTGVGARIDSVLRFFFGQKKVVEKTTLPAKRWPRFVHRDGEQVPLLHLLGLPRHHDRLGRDADPGPVPDVLAARRAGRHAGRLRSTPASTSSAAWCWSIIGFAFFRRIVLQPRLIPMSRDAAAILGAIALLMLSYFGMRFASGTLAEVSWWIHVVILLAFLNYLPYSKHSHILAALPNIYFRNLGQRGVLPKLNLEADDMAATGVVQGWKDFTWKSLLDGYACTECARCTNFCPAYNTGKPLSPMQVVHDLRDDLRFRMPDRGPLDVHARALPARRVGGRAARRGRQAADRRPHHRRHAVGVHDLRRLPGGLPGVHRAAREDPADAPEPGAGAGEDAARSGAHVHQPRAQRQPVGHRRRQAHGLGRRA